MHKSINSATYKTIKQLWQKIHGLYEEPEGCYLFKSDFQAFM